MADTKIKDLTHKTPAARTDELPINDVAGGNLDKYVTVSDILGQVLATDVPGTAMVRNATETVTGAKTFTTLLLKVADIADANGNISIAATATSSAVDYLTVVNAATANPAYVQVNATGSDSNVGIELRPKGTGKIRITDGSDTTKKIVFDVSGTTAGKTLTLAYSVTNDRTVTFPDSTATLATTAQLTDGSTITGLVNAQFAAGCALAFSKLAALTSANILVGNGSNVATSVAMSGDVTIDNTGATTIGANKVTSSKLAAAVNVIGKQDIWIPAAAMWANTTNPATGLTQTETSTNKLNYKSWSFGDNATSDKVEFTWTPPRNWDFGTVKVTYTWLPLAGSGTVIFQTAGVAIGDNSAIDVAQGTAVSTTDTIQSTGNVHISPQSTAITIAGTPASTKVVQFRITRDNSDTSTSAALLLGVTIEYSITQATAA